MKNSWTKEEEEDLIRQFNEGVKPIVIPGRTKNAINARKRSLGLYKKRYTKEELLEFVKKYRSYNSMQYNRLPSEPSPKMLVTKFGSWEAAAAAAGVGGITSGLRPDRETILYLVRLFDKFYKIGITQQTGILSRFRSRGIKDVRIIDSVTFSNLQEAIETERELLSFIKPYLIDTNIEGFSECFEVERNLTELLDLYAP